MSKPELLASYWTICGGAEPHTDHEFSPFGLPERAAAAAKAGFTGLGIWHADLRAPDGAAQAAGDAPDPH